MLGPLGNHFKRMLLGFESDVRAFARWSCNHFEYVRVFGTMLAALSGHLWTIAKPFRDHLGTMLGQFLENADTILEPLWNQHGTILGPFREHGEAIVRQLGGAS